MRVYVYSLFNAQIHDRHTQFVYCLAPLLPRQMSVRVFG